MPRALITRGGSSGVQGSRTPRSRPRQTTGPQGTQGSSNTADESALPQWLQGLADRYLTPEGQEILENIAETDLSFPINPQQQYTPYDLAAWNFFYDPANKPPPLIFLGYVTGRPEQKHGVYAGESSGLKLELTVRVTHIAANEGEPWHEIKSGLMRFRIPNKEKHAWADGEAIMVQGIPEEPDYFDAFPYPRILEAQGVTTVLNNNSFRIRVKSFGMTDNTDQRVDANDRVFNLVAPHIRNYLTATTEYSTTKDGLVADRDLTAERVPFGIFERRSRVTPAIDEVSSVDPWLTTLYGGTLATVRAINAITPFSHALEAIYADSTAEAISEIGLTVTTALGYGFTTSTIRALRALRKAPTPQQLAQLQHAYNQMNQANLALQQAQALYNQTASVVPGLAPTQASLQQARTTLSQALGRLDVATQASKQLQSTTQGQNLLTQLQTNLGNAQNQLQTAEAALQRHQANAGQGVTQAVNRAQALGQQLNGLRTQLQNELRNTNIDFTQVRRIRRQISQIERQLKSVPRGAQPQNAASLPGRLAQVGPTLRHNVSLAQSQVSQLQTTVQAVRNILISNPNATPAQILQQLQQQSNYAQTQYNTLQTNFTAARGLTNINPVTAQNTVNAARQTALTATRNFNNVMARNAGAAIRSTRGIPFVSPAMTNILGFFDMHTDPSEGAIDTFGRGFRWVYDRSVGRVVGKFPRIRLPASMGRHADRQLYLTARQNLEMTVRGQAPGTVQIVGQALSHGFTNLRTAWGNMSRVPAGLVGRGVALLPGLTALSYSFLSGTPGLSGLLFSSASGVASVATPGAAVTAGAALFPITGFGIAAYTIGTDIHARVTGEYDEIDNAGAQLFEEQYRRLGIQPSELARISPQLARFYDPELHPDLPQEEVTFVQPRAETWWNPRPTDPFLNLTQPQQQLPEFTENALAGRTGTVTAINDGDTVQVRFDDTGRVETVRILDVDTPETKHPERPEGLHGAGATEFTTQLLNQRVSVETHGLDRYDRTLGYVFTTTAFGGGQSLNWSHELLRNAWGIYNDYGEPSTHSAESARIWTEVRYPSDSQAVADAITPNYIPFLSLEVPNLLGAEETNLRAERAEQIERGFLAETEENAALLAASLAEQGLTRLPGPAMPLDVQIDWTLRGLPGGDTGGGYNPLMHAYLENLSISETGVHLTNPDQPVRPIITTATVARFEQIVVDHDLDPQQTALLAMAFSRGLESVSGINAETTFDNVRFARTKPTEPLNPENFPDLYRIMGGNTQLAHIYTRFSFANQSIVDAYVNQNVNLQGWAGLGQYDRTPHPRVHTIAEMERATLEDQLGINIPTDPHQIFQNFADYSVLFPLTTAIEAAPQDLLGIIEGRIGQPTSDHTPFSDPMQLNALEPQEDVRLTQRQRYLLRLFDKDRDGVIHLRELQRYGIRGVSEGDEIFPLMDNPKGRNVIGLPDDNTLYGRMILDDPEATSEEIAARARLQPLSAASIRLRALHLTFNTDGLRTITKKDLEAVGVNSVPSGHFLAQHINAESLIDKDEDNTTEGQALLDGFTSQLEAYNVRGALTGNFAAADRVLREAAAREIYKQTSEIESLDAFSAQYQAQITEAQRYAYLNEEDLRQIYGNASGKITLTSLDKFGIQGLTSIHPLYHLMDNDFADHEIGNPDKNSFYANLILADPEITTAEMRAAARAIPISKEAARKQAVHDLYNYDGEGKILQRDLHALGIFSVPDTHPLVDFIELKSIINNKKANTPEGQALLDAAANQELLNGLTDAAEAAIRRSNVLAIDAQVATLEGIANFAIQNEQRILWAKNYADRYKDQLLAIFDANESKQITSNELEAFGIFGVDATSPIYHLMNDTEGDYVIGEIDDNTSIANVLLAAPNRANADLALQAVADAETLEDASTPTLDTKVYLQNVVLGWDTNGSGTLSLKELKAATQLYDANGKKIRGTAIQGVRRGDPWYDFMYDPNKDGKIGNLKWRDSEKGRGRVGQFAQTVMNQVIGVVETTAALPPRRQIVEDAEGLPLATADEIPDFPDEDEKEPPPLHPDLTPGQVQGLTLVFDRADGILHKNDLNARGIYNFDRSHPLFRLLGDEDKTTWGSSKKKNTPAGQALLDRTRETIPDTTPFDPAGTIVDDLGEALPPEFNPGRFRLPYRRTPTLENSLLSDIIDTVATPQGNINDLNTYRDRLHNPTAERSLARDILAFNVTSHTGTIATARAFRHFFLPDQVAQTAAIPYNQSMVERIPGAPLDDLLVLKTVLNSSYKRTEPLRTTPQSRPPGFWLTSRIPERNGLPRIEIYTNDGHSLTGQQKIYYNESLPRLIRQWMTDRQITTFPRGYNENRVLTILVDQDLSYAFGYFDPKFSPLGMNAIHIQPGRTANHELAVQHELDHWVLQLHADTLVSAASPEQIQASMTNALRFIQNNTAAEFPAEITGPLNSIYTAALKTARSIPDPASPAPPDVYAQAHDPRLEEGGPSKIGLEMARGDRDQSGQTFRNLFSTGARVENIRTINEYDLLRDAEAAPLPLPEEILYGWPRLSFNAAIRSASLKGYKPFYRREDGTFSYATFGAAQFPPHFVAQTPPTRPPANATPEAIRAYRQRILSAQTIDSLSTEFAESGFFLPQGMALEEDFSGFYLTDGMVTDASIVVEDAFDQPLSANTQALENIFPNGTPSYPDAQSNSSFPFLELAANPDYRVVANQTQMSYNIQDPRTFLQTNVEHVIGFEHLYTETFTTRVGDDVAGIVTLASLPDAPIDDLLMVYSMASGGFRAREGILSVEDELRVPDTPDGYYLYKSIPGHNGTPTINIYISNIFTDQGILGANPDDPHTPIWVKKPPPSEDYLARLQFAAENSIPLWMQTRGQDVFPEGYSGARDIDILLSGDDYAPGYYDSGHAFQYRDAIHVDHGFPLNAHTFVHEIDHWWLTYRGDAAAAQATPEERRQAIRSALTWLHGSTNLRPQLNPHGDYDAAFRGEFELALADLGPFATEEQLRERGLAILDELPTNMAVNPTATSDAEIVPQATRIKLPAGQGPASLEQYLRYLDDNESLLNIDPETKAAIASGRLKLPPGFAYLSEHDLVVSSGERVRGSGQPHSLIQPNEVAPALAAYRNGVLVPNPGLGYKWLQLGIEDTTNLYAGGLAAPLRRNELEAKQLIAAERRFLGATAARAATGAQAFLNYPFGDPGRILSDLNSIVTPFYENLNQQDRLLTPLEEIQEDPAAALARAQAGLITLGLAGTRLSNDIGEIAATTGRLPGAFEAGLYESLITQNAAGRIAQIDPELLNDPTGAYTLAVIGAQYITADPTQGLITRSALPRAATNYTDQLFQLTPAQLLQNPAGRSTQPASQAEQLAYRFGYATSEFAHRTAIPALTPAAQQLLEYQRFREATYARTRYGPGLGTGRLTGLPAGASPYSIQNVIPATLEEMNRIRVQAGLPVSYGPGFSPYYTTGAGGTAEEILRRTQMTDDQVALSMDARIVGVSGAIGSLLAANPQLLAALGVSSAASLPYVLLGVVAVAGIPGIAETIRQLATDPAAREQLHREIQSLITVVQQGAHFTPLHSATLGRIIPAPGTSLVTPTTYLDPAHPTQFRSREELAARDRAVQAHAQRLAEQQAAPITPEQALQLADTFRIFGQIDAQALSDALNAQIALQIGDTLSNLNLPHLSTLTEALTADIDRRREQVVQDVVNSLEIGGLTRPIPTPYRPRVGFTSDTDPFLDTFTTGGLQLRRPVGRQPAPGEQDTFEFAQGSLELPPTAQFQPDTVTDEIALLIAINARQTGRTESEALRDSLEQLPLTSPYRPAVGFTPDVDTFLESFTTGGLQLRRRVGDAPAAGELDPFIESFTEGGLALPRFRPPVSFEQETDPLLETFTAGGLALPRFRPPISFEQQTDPLLETFTGGGLRLRRPVAFASDVDPFLETFTQGGLILPTAAPFQPDTVTDEIALLTAIARTLPSTPQSETLLDSLDQLTLTRPFRPQVGLVPSIADTDPFQPDTGGLRLRRPVGDTPAAGELDILDFAQGSLELPPAAQFQPDTVTDEIALLTAIAHSAPNTPQSQALLDGLERLTLTRPYRPEVAFTPTDAESDPARGFLTTTQSLARTADQRRVGVLADIADSLGLAGLARELRPPYQPATQTDTAALSATDGIATAPRRRPSAVTQPQLDNLEQQRLTRPYRPTVDFAPTDAEADPNRGFLTSTRSLSQNIDQRRTAILADVAASLGLADLARALRPAHQPDTTTDSLAAELARAAPAARTRTRTVDEILALIEADPESLQLTPAGIAVPPVQFTPTDAEADPFFNPAAAPLQLPLIPVQFTPTAAEADPFRPAAAEPITPAPSAAEQTRRSQIFLAQQATNTLNKRLDRQDAIAAQLSAFDAFEGASQRPAAFNAVTPLIAQEVDEFAFPSSPLSIRSVQLAAPQYATDEEDPYLAAENVPLRTTGDLLFGFVGHLLETTDISAPGTTVAQLRNISRTINRTQQPQQPRPVGAPVDVVTDEEQIIQTTEDLIQTIRDNAAGLPPLADGRTIDQLSDDEILSLIQQDGFIPQSPGLESDYVDPYRYLIRENFGDFVVYDERDNPADTLSEIRNSAWWLALTALAAEAHLTGRDATVRLRNRYYRIGDRSYPYNQAYPIGQPPGTGQAGEIKEDKDYLQRKGRKRRPGLGDPIRLPERKRGKSGNLAGIALDSNRQPRDPTRAAEHSRRRNRSLKGIALRT